MTDTCYVTAGYRAFEGGVDNERFAFGWYNFAVVSIGARFWVRARTKLPQRTHRNSDRVN